MKFLLYITLLTLIFSCTSNPERPIWERVTIDDDGIGADGIKLSYLNKDDHLDMVVGWEQSGIVKAYISPEQKGQLYRSITVNAPSVEDAFAMDIDGDGGMDLVSLSEGKDQNIRFHFGPASNSMYLDSSNWESHILGCSSKKTKWMFGLEADIDGINGKDIIVGGKAHSFVGWLESPQDPRKLEDWKLHRLCDIEWVMSIYAIDMNQDGYEDILFSDRKGDSSGIYWLEHPGKILADVQWQLHYLGLKGKHPLFFDVQIISDGNMEILSGSENRNIYHCRSIANEWQCEEYSLPSEAPRRAKAAIMGNLDTDKELEWVITTEGALDKTGVWLFDDGQFIPISDDLGEKYDYALLHDVDQDGDLDILTCEEANNGQNGNGLGLIWYKNPLIKLD